MTATAVRDKSFKQLLQPLSGFALGWEMTPTWRVQIQRGNSHFLSKAKYTSEKAAKAAAKRINDKGSS